MHIRTHAYAYIHTCTHTHTPPHPHPPCWDWWEEQWSSASPPVSRPECPPPPCQWGPARISHTSDSGPPAPACCCGQTPTSASTACSRGSWGQRRPCRSGKWLPVRHTEDQTPANIGQWQAIKHLQTCKWQVPSNICTTYDSDKSPQTSAQHMTVTSPIKHLHNIWQWQVPSNICTPCNSDKSHQTSAHHTTVTSPIKHPHSILPHWLGTGLIKTYDNKLIKETLLCSLSWMLTLL